MPSTTVYNLRYPALSDAPDGPAQIQALAEDVEAELVRVDADITALQTANIRHGVILQQSVVQVMSVGLNAVSNMTVLGSDPDGYFDGAATFDRLKIPAGLGGLYFVGFRYQGNTVATAGAVFARLIRNSTTSTELRASMAFDAITHGGQVIPLAAADFFKMEIQSNVGHSSVLTGTQMYAYRIGN